MKDPNFLIMNGANLQASLELFGDMQTYNELVVDYAKALDEKLPKIKQYKEASDMANYAILVHSLKSDSKTFGFMKLGELAYNHEMKSKANDSDYVFNTFDELMTEANRVRTIVKQYLGQAVSEEEMGEQRIRVKEKAILVVDDSAIVCNFIKKIFNDEYIVLMASDGNEALKIVETTAPGKIVAMLLDLNMPKVDGFQVLDYWNQNNLFYKIPVSIITGAEDKETINKACQYKIVDMLLKPFNERDVKMVVEKTINLN